MSGQAFQSGQDNDPGQVLISLRDGQDQLAALQAQRGFFQGLAGAPGQPQAKPDRKPVRDRLVNFLRRTDFADLFDRLGLLLAAVSYEQRQRDLHPFGMADPDKTRHQGPGEGQIPLEVGMGFPADIADVAGRLAQSFVTFILAGENRVDPG